jgi:uncharacterized protein YbjT (DUF2867 family)
MSEAIKVILTGATGLVGEGVLFACLEHPDVQEVLTVSRRHYDLKHPKLKELLVPDFFSLDKYTDQLKGYDACFYCAGISSSGMSEAAYTKITYDTPIHFAETLLPLNPGMIFGHISSGYTDSTEKGKFMWARVKGKAENALMRIPFKHVYNFRPALMKPTAGQKNIKGYYKIVSALFPLFHVLMRGNSVTLREVGLAMINSVLTGYDKQVLEVADIKKLAAV